MNGVPGWPTPLGASDLRTQAEKVFEAFLKQESPARALVICHSDADGLSSGALLGRLLPRVDVEASVEPTGKGENAWSERLRQVAARDAFEALFVVDLGIRAAPVCRGKPTLLIDHHRPLGIPPDAVLVSGYGSTPTPTTSLLTFWCCAGIRGAPDLQWLAALGVVGDLGDRALLSEFKDVDLFALRTLSALLNAPRRTARGDASAALKLLLTANSPQEILFGQSEEVRLIKEAQKEVRSALADAKRTAPKFSGRTAMIAIHTPYLVHPIVAQIWRSRLAGYVVICANFGYRPGYVHFSVRSSSDENLIDFLLRHAPSDPGSEFAGGHDQATGGSLSDSAWNEFAGNLGFTDELKAPWTV